MDSQNTLTDKISIQDGSLIVYKIAVEDESKEPSKESTETKPKIKWDIT